MAYVKTNWVDNTTPINETNLNKIEQGIYDNLLVVDAITNTLNPTDTETYKTAELTEGQITDVIGVKDILIKGQTSQNGEPTPSSPVDVNVVSGSNVINTSNKNLVEKNLKGYIAAEYMSIDNSSESFVFWAEQGKTYNYSCLKSTNRGVCAKSETINIVNGTPLTNIRTVSNSFTSNFTGWCVLYVNSNLDNEIKDSFMIEQGSTATTYEPHQGKELPLDLGSIELCKIGTYQDYFYKSGSKWYLHKEINKITSYNGETITTSYISTTGELSTGAKVYYVVTPTDTKITDTTLISQLEAIYNAPLYEQTNITQTNNDLPMILDITACKDNIKGIKAFIRK